MIRPARPVLAVLVGVALVAAGCGGTVPTGPTPSAAPRSVFPQANTGVDAASAPGTLVIKDFTFGGIAVRAGSVVTVLNEDPAAHTVTSRQKGLFDVMTPPNATARFVAPSTPGRYPFYCLYHGDMTGFLVVN